MEVGTKEKAQFSKKNAFKRNAVRTKIWVVYIIRNGPFGGTCTQPKELGFKVIGLVTDSVHVPTTDASNTPLGLFGWLCLASHRVLLSGIYRASVSKASEPAHVDQHSNV